MNKILKDILMFRFCHKLIPILKVVPAEEELLEQALIEMIVNTCHITKNAQSVNYNFYKNY